MTRSGVVGAGTGDVCDAHDETGRGAKYRIAIPIARTCGRELSYVAVICRVSPARTGRPAGSSNAVIAVGPGSCITGRGSIPPHVGYEV